MNYSEATKFIRLANLLHNLGIVDQLVAVDFMEFNIPEQNIRTRANIQKVLAVVHEVYSSETKDIVDRLAMQL